MAKRRTKKQKSKTSAKRSVEQTSNQTEKHVSLQFDSSILGETKTSVKKKTNRKKASSATFSYDSRYFNQDLSKTLILSILVIGFELVLYFYLKIG